MRLLGRVPLLPALLCLTGCETLSTPLAQPTADRKASVSASIMVDCDAPVFIPAGTDRTAEYRLWGRDRKALADCRATNAAKADTINALQGGGT
ncbi:hypothetical protein RvVAR0630_23840 [Agrobacterium vitis]|nr:hypothetical protein RvVAR0630_23840 [Agrobacterium vitis]